MKIIFKLIATLLFIIIIFVGYMSLIGYETKRFNDQIIKKIENINENLSIELKEIKIILDPLNFKLNIKTIGSKLKNKNKSLEIQNINTQIPIRSFFSEQILIESLKISTEALRIKDFISFIRVFNRSPELYLLEKIIDKGFLIADIKLNFDKSGNIKNDYQITGLVKDTNINILKKYKIKKLSFDYDYKKENLNLEGLSFLFNDLKLNSKKISVNNLKNEFIIKGELNNSDTKLNNKDLKLLLKPYIQDLNIIKIDFNSNNQFSFKINKKFQFKDLEWNSNIELNELSLLNQLNLKKFFPKIKDIILFDNHKIKLNYKKNIFQIIGEGNILLQENKDKLSYFIKKEEKNYELKSKLTIKENPFFIDFMNFKKNDKSEMIINIDGVKNLDNSTKFKIISLKENKNKIDIDNLTLNRKFQLIDFKNLEIDYIDQDNLKNKFTINSTGNNYKLIGASFNANKLIENLIKNDENSNFITKNFKVDIDIDKLFLDKKNILNKFNGSLTFNDKVIISGGLTGKFSKDKILKFTVETNNEEKITTLFSDKAEPIVSRYKFIKGFDEGMLDFNSTKKEGQSFSTVKIYDFKLKELPALTKLLTLASLQGIADLLSGEGIRFNEFEMNFTNKGDLMTIEEIYAIGPAISILMNGYVEKDKLISLRGTLVPATTINKAIGSIPVLGKILVGSKTGEGVFGVSFKIKGPPKDLQTTVNPIKTLTPRFITRTLEKIKKN